MKKVSNHTHLDLGLFLSLLLHLGLAFLAILAPVIFPAFGETTWGTDNEEGDSMQVRIISSISGIALPAPIVVNESAAANESAGFYNSALAKASEITDLESDIELTSIPTQSSSKPATSIHEADNTVPFGEGGRPAINYGQTGNLESGVGGIAESSFGDLYGSYVEAITRRISGNWLQSTIDVKLRQAPRLYINFDILQDGTISNVRILKSSGNRSLDRSARRAVFASSPLAPLPSEFRGSTVQVSFWFEHAQQ